MDIVPLGMNINCFLYFKTASHLRQIIMLCIAGKYMAKLEQKMRGVVTELHHLWVLYSDEVIDC